MEETLRTHIGQRFLVPARASFQVVENREVVVAQRAQQEWFAGRDRARRGRLEAHRRLLPGRYLALDGGLVVVEDDAVLLRVFAPRQRACRVAPVPLRRQGGFQPLGPLPARPVLQRAAWPRPPLVQGLDPAVARPHVWAVRLHVGVSVHLVACVFDRAVVDQAAEVVVPHARLVTGVNERVRALRRRIIDDRIRENRGHVRDREGRCTLGFLGCLCGLRGGGRDREASHRHHRRARSGHDAQESRRAVVYVGTGIVPCRGARRGGGAPRGVSVVCVCQFHAYSVAAGHCARWLSPN